ncbi:hypothetical protein RD792_000092 [Penstemon davidsonii]|uniref:peroxidase n=1 Tax=Penstemon davidsonii TaxID=160366 RepID=A0ABR0DUE4_9LAMI|nr:hypothetical protein RD792_000092 [Penstemon davidsonii]
MAFKVIAIFVLFLAVLTISCNAQSLKIGFYEKTCPNVEAIVKQTTNTIFSKAPTLAAAILRMHFHDCFVRGCDGSILLNATGNGQAEKNAIPNLSLRGFGSIDRVKSVVEKKCPGVVSCADILALAARDAVSFERRTVPASPTYRLYNFTGRGDSDPLLDSEYVPRLMSKCRPGDQTTLAEMDPGSFKTFDEDYYTLVAKRRGLFTSDSALLDDNVTRAYVRRHAVSSQRLKFFEDFAVSMVKMGNIEVLTGSNGEIRRQCAFVN